MKKTIFTRMAVLMLAVVFCLTLAVPSFAAPADAVAPLENLTIAGAKTADYALAPAFQQNTQIYTVTAASDKMPTSLTTAQGILDVTAPAAYGMSTYAYNASTQMLTITTDDNNGGTTTYYVFFSDKSGQESAAKNKADINVMKVLEADADAKLDELTFTYDLFAVEIVENTAPVGTTTIPLALDGNTDKGTAATGTATVTAPDATKSQMLMDNWEGANVHKLTNAEATKMSRLDLENSRVIEGTFTIEYETVGQYKYLLHEQKGSTTGVTYRDNWYEITVSAVHENPNDPTSDVVIGWIEVRSVTGLTGNSYTAGTTYTAGAKVNFGTDDGNTGNTIDNEKYDNSTTSITYPYINTLATEDLNIKKDVTGDLGDKNQEFLFKLTITGDNLAAAYDITYTTAGTLAPISITTGTTSPHTTGTAYITLKHGQSATIADLPVGVTYSLTEIGAAATNEEKAMLASYAEADNYNTTVTYDNANGTGTEVLRETAVGKIIASQAIINTDKTSHQDTNYVNVVNDKPLTPPTGAFADMIPYIAIVAVAVSGIVVFAAVKKHRASYDD